MQVPRGVADVRLVSNTWNRLALVLWIGTLLWLLVDLSTEAARRTVLAGAVTASIWAAVFTLRPLLESALQYAYSAGERHRSSDRDA